MFVLQESRTCSAVVKFISAGDKESIYEEGDRKKEGGDGAGGWGWVRGTNRMLDEQMRKVARPIFQNRRSRRERWKVPHGFKSAKVCWHSNRTNNTDNPYQGKSPGSQIEDGINRENNMVCVRAERTAKQ